MEHAPSNLGENEFPRVFHTTNWGIVLAAGRMDCLESREALEALCRTYWYPLYAFVRWRGNNPHQAEDLTQAFFEMLLSRRSLAAAQASRGRFRSFLLVALSNFLADQHAGATAEKRGGKHTIVPFDPIVAEERFGLEPRDDRSPDVIFDKAWARTVLQEARNRLTAVYQARGRERLNELLLAWELGDDGLSVSSIAAQIGMSETGVRTAAMRWRRQYRDAVRAEVARTVAITSETNEEIRQLLSIVSS